MFFGHLLRWDAKLSAAAKVFFFIRWGEDNTYFELDELGVIMCNKVHDEGRMLRFNMDSYVAATTTKTRMILGSLTLPLPQAAGNSLVFWLCSGCCLQEPYVMKSYTT